jgi:hypothetical protein
MRLSSPPGPSARTSARLRPRVSLARVGRSAPFPGGIGVVLMLVLLLLPSMAEAQLPPPLPPLPIPGTLPDTLRADDLPAEAVEAGQEADLQPDSIPPVVPRNVPQGRIPPPRQPEPGVWEWEREDLLASPSLTLHDLVSFVPGVTLVRGGDVGAPVGFSVFGSGGGQVRVFLDGVEDAPLEGGVVDLAQVGMTGLERVRLERGPADVRLYLTTHQIDDPRPFTLLEVATGDLRTNLFRAGFVHPDALGGTLLVALDRADSDGPRREEAGAAYGTRFRYSLFPRDGVGIALEYRSRTARRPEGTYEPEEVRRSEVSARMGWELSESLTAEFHALQARAELGRRADPAADSLLPEEARRSLGGRVTWSPAGGPLAAWVSGARHSGEGWPQDRLEAGVTASLAALGGVTARWDREGWSDLAIQGRESAREPATGGAGGWSVRGWTTPRAGLSLFAEAEQGRRGLPFVVPAPPEPSGENGAGENGEPGPVPVDPVRIHQRDGFRAGGRFAWRDLDLSAAWFRVETDELPPLGLPFDRRGVTLPGGVRTGMEVEGRVPLTPLLRGLSLRGGGQIWEAAGDDGWRYLPDRMWTGQLAWYHEGYDGNLEVWADLGLRGRDPMALPVSDGLGGVDGVIPGTAPFQQSWFARLQFRVVTVRVFIHWETINFKDDNADLPDRFLPQTRAMYGVRWTMWN